MADLVVGISKTAIQSLADKVKTAIKEEAEQWQIVQRDLVFITGEFEMMQSFLDSVTEEHVKNKIVRTWARQVRELSNDVEDNIDFILHIDTGKRAWWLRLLPSCGGKIREPLKVDDAVAETTLLRARVVDVSQRSIRYNLIVNSASKPMASMDQVQKMAAASTSSFDTLINAVKKSGLLDLARLITRADTQLQVISVCGTEGDLVKEAIVRKMYSDSSIDEEFQCRAWVKLMHPFTPHEFIRSVMTQFFTQSCQEQDAIVGLEALARMQQATQGDCDLIREFAQQVKKHRYLIVLEDLCTMVQWDAIRSYLPDRKNGSRIVVLTHQPVIASQCTGEPCRVSELGQFSPGHSVRVYYKEGFQHDRGHSFIKAERDHSLLNYGLFGRDTEMHEVFEKTQNIQESRVISVWGMSGVGKSALVDAIYRKLSTSKEFKRHAWVSVSHPFNPTEFSRSLLVGLHSESTSLSEETSDSTSLLEAKYKDAFRAKDPIKDCRDYLRARECVCLLVIDGVQSNEDWDWIKSNLIQDGDSRRCIIIITLEESVAKHCALSSSIDGVYHVKGLHAAAANELFEKVLKENGCYLEEEQMKEEAGLVLSKCGGLPKAIITVARYLSRKPREFKQEKRRLNDNFMHELMANPELDSLRTIQSWMDSYLKACPGHLKKCMLYLSIFPQDIIIGRRRLIRRWIAEGYSKGNDSISSEKYAEKIFDEVAALSIMQPAVTEAAGKVGYRVNGFFREYIMSRLVEETIFFPVEVSALENQQGHGRLTTQGIGQHLAIIGSSRDEDQILFKSLDLSRLRSLSVFNGWFWSFHLSDRMRVLRVLDLENAYLVDSYFEGIKKLPSRLKFLSLRGQSKIKWLPISVADLVQLQTLDIRGTSIVTLPPFITKLTKLQYIRAGSATKAWSDDYYDISSSHAEEQSSCLPKFLGRRPAAGSSRDGGVEVPRGIRRLKALQTFGAVDVNTARGEAILNEIRCLPQLMKLELSGISRKLRKYCLLWLDIITHLESLSLQFVKNNHFLGEHRIQLPRGLRSLKMYGHVVGLPRNIKDLDSLVKVTLEMPTLYSGEVVIHDLGSIPSLRTLRLRVKNDQRGELEFRPNRFIRLQVLEIACKSNLHVRFDEGAMEKLEQLKFHCLGGSEIGVSGLQHPVSLKQVWLLGSFDDTLKEALQQQLGTHPKIPAPKLEVQPRSSED